MKFSLYFLGVFTLMFGHTSLADDCAAIRKQISALPVSGGLVFVKAGIYNCTASIVINQSHVQLLGAGENQTIIRLADRVHCPLLIIGDKHTELAASGNYETSHHVSDIEVSNMTFDGNRKNHDPKRECGEGLCDGDPSSVRNNGITIRGADHVVIKNVTSHSMISGGLVTEKYCDHITVTDFTSYNNFFDGFAGYQTEHSTFSNLFLHHNRGAGVSIDIDFNNNILRNSRIEDNQSDGIFAQRVHGNKFLSFSILRSGEFGVFLAKVDTAESCATDNQFDSMQIHFSKKSGFRLNNDCPGNRITGKSNLCHNFGTSINDEFQGPLLVESALSCH